VCVRERDSVSGCVLSVGVSVFVSVSVSMSVCACACMSSRISSDWQVWLLRCVCVCVNEGMCE